MNEAHPPRPPRPPRDSLAALTDDRGRVLRIPKRSQPRDAVLDYLASHVTVGRDYSEAEVNDILDDLHTFHDPALLRRMLFDSGRLDRDPDGRNYRRPG